MTINNRIITNYQEFLRVNKSETVEIPLAANTFRYQFPILQNLKNTLIIGLESFVSTQMTYTPTGNPVIVAADYNRSFLQIANPKNRLMLNNLPLYSLQSFPGFLRLADYIDADWQNCFVNIGNSAVAVTTPTSFLFTVYYIDKQNKDALMKRIQQWLGILDKQD